MYKCSLNSAQIKRYLDYLEKHRLVNKNIDEKKSYYKTTELGYQYLDAYDKIRQILGFKESI